MGVVAASSLCRKGIQTILARWAIVAFACALATIGGYVLSRVVGAHFTGGFDGFAAGAHYW
jgi:hypothetical protein